MNLAEISKQIGIDLAAMAEDLEPVEGSYDFKLFTRDHSGNGTVVKAFERSVEGQDEPDFIIAGIASSTIKDLHGDTMLPSAIMDMEKAARNNLTLYLNHKYTVPEDIAGSCIKATVSSSANSEDGSPIYDLEFETKVDKTNPRAVQTFKSLKGGTKLGMSIGANIPEGGAIRNKKTGALLIAHVDLLETSIVAIPANPRSWIDSGVKAIKSGVRADKTNEQIILEAAAPVMILGSTDPGVVLGQPLPAVDGIMQEFDPTTGASYILPDGTKTKDQTVALAAAADTGSTAAIQGQGKCPTCGKPKGQGGDCKDPFHKTKDASETIVSGDTVLAAGDPATNTTTPSQGAPQSGPGNDGSATEAVIASATDVLERTGDLTVTGDLAKALLEAHNALAEVTDSLIDQSRARIDLERQVETLTRERDQAIRRSQDVVTEVAALIEALGALPVGQKASFKRIQEDFAGLESVYPEEFVRQLRSIGK